MGELMTVDGQKPLEDRRIFVLYPNPIAAVDIAERLEEAGAEALPIFDLRQLSWGLSAKLPDGAIAELDEHVGWAATAVAVLHELAVPQVLGATERRRLLLRSKMPNAVFMPAPLDPAVGLQSLVVLLESHWPRLLRHAAFAPRRTFALPMEFSGDRDQRPATEAALSLGSSDVRSPALQPGRQKRGAPSCPWPESPTATTVDLSLRLNSS